MQSSCGPSLFDLADTWLTAPVEAFTAWLVSDDFALRGSAAPCALRESSVRVYLAMFRKFARQVLDGAGARPAKTLPEVSTDDIRAFLDDNQLKTGIRARYVRLLERVYDHLARKGVPCGNPARGLAVTQPRSSSQGNTGTQWLTVEQQAAVIAALPDGPRWKQRRNRALMATVLGGGLKASEVIGLALRNIGARQADGGLLLEVRPSGAGRWHRTRVAPFAVAILAEWLITRETLGLASELLFPARRTGATLHPATVYRQVAAVLAAAGIPAEAVKRRGARTLRNTYALQELAAGQPAGLVGEYLGHRADRSTRYYTELLGRLQGRDRSAQG